MKHLRACHQDARCVKTGCLCACHEVGVSEKQDRDTEFVTAAYELLRKIKTASDKDLQHLVLIDKRDLKSLLLALSVLSRLAGVLNKNTLRVLTMGETAAKNLHEHIK